MIKYEVIIDGVDYGDKILNGVPIAEEIADNLDTATIQFISDEEMQIERFKNAKISIFYDNYYTKDWNFLTNEHSSVWQRKGYINTLSLIEPTKILETFVFSGFAVTRHILPYQISVAVGKINARLSLTSKYRLELDYNTILEEIGPLPSEEFVYSDFITAREILDDMLSVADRDIRVSELEDNGDTISVKLVIENPSRKGKNLEQHFYPNNLERYQESDFSTQGIITTGTNALGEQSLQEPFRVLLSPDGNQTSNTAFLNTKYGISSIGKCLVLTDLTVRWAYYKDVLDPQLEYKEVLHKDMLIDITDYIVDNERFQTMVFSERKRIAFFNRNEKGVFGFLTEIKEPLNNTFVYENMFYDSALNNPRNEYLRNIILAKPDNEYDYAFSGFKYPNWQTFKFELTYTPLFDCWALPTKDISNTLIGTRTIDNQSAKIIDVRRFINTAQNKTDRMGNNQLNYDTRVYSLSTLFDLGDYIGDYRIDKREMSLKRDYIDVRYHFSEKYNSINERIKVNREVRVYNIPIENYVKTTLIWELEEEEDALDYIYNKAANFKIKTSAMDTGLYYICLPIVKYRTGDFVYLTASFVDNYSAGSRVETDSNGNKIVKAVSYVNSLGEFQWINWEVTAGVNSDYNASLYPLVNYSDFFPIDYVLRKEFNYQKDAFEHIEIVVKIKSTKL